MNKITKQKQREFMRTQLETNDKWALRGLVKIYQYQTEEEKNAYQTIDDNGVGFSGVDSEILTSFANQYLRYGRLSPKQMALLKKKIKKYWRQLLAISDEKKLNLLIVRNEK